MEKKQGDLKCFYCEKVISTEFEDEDTVKLETGTDEIVHTVCHEQFATKN